MSVSPDLQSHSLYSGDHVMGWSTSIVSPPDGNMGDYMRSLARLKARDDRVFWPGHGGPINQPEAMVQAFIEHRQAREQQVLECLAREAMTLSELVPVIYHDIDSALYPAAERSLMACVMYLTEQKLIAARESASKSLSISMPPTNAKLYRL